MAKQAYTKTITDKESGLTYEFKLGDISINVGSRVQMTQIKNAGKDNEKRIPPVNLQQQINTSGTPESEDFEDKLAEHPFIKDFIELILAQAAKPYSE